MRFVTGVDDRSFEGCLKSDFLFEEIGSLTDLERNDVGRETDFTSDLSCTAVDLTGHKMRCDFSDDSTEGKASVNEIILMTSIRVPFAVGVVLVDNNRLTIGQKSIGRAH